MSRDAGAQRIFASSSAASSSPRPAPPRLRAFHGQLAQGVRDPLLGVNRARAGRAGVVGRGRQTPARRGVEAPRDTGVNAQGGAGRSTLLDCQSRVGAVSRAEQERRKLCPQSFRAAPRSAGQALPWLREDIVWTGTRVLGAWRVQGQGVSRRSGVARDGLQLQRPSRKASAPAAAIQRALQLHCEARMRRRVYAACKGTDRPPLCSVARLRIGHQHRGLGPRRRRPIRAREVYGSSGAAGGARRQQRERPERWRDGGAAPFAVRRRVSAHCTKLQTSLTTNPVALDCSGWDTNPQPLGEIPSALLFELPGRPSGLPMTSPCAASSWLPLPRRCAIGDSLTRVTAAPVAKQRVVLPATNVAAMLVAASSRNAARTRAVHSGVHSHLETMCHTQSPCHKTTVARLHLLACSSAPSRSCVYAAGRCWHRSETH
jgi:hypothetical protein